MISRERLQELIENDGTVYCVGDNVYKITLDKRYFCILGNYLQWSKFLDKPMLQRTPHIDDIYETKEDAEFAKEFKNVHRIDTLCLPTFEELKKIERFDFKAKDGYKYTIHFISGFNTLAITGQISNKYYGEATKENYMEACKMVKKLFLEGEMYENSKN